MSTDAMSPERTRAYYKFKEAEQQAAKHHYDQAIGLARDALEADPSFTEARHWIVSLYLQTDQKRKASLELQDILHVNHEDQQAWERLREIDPAAAERLERLHTIAPDPFVVQRTSENAISEDLDDLGGLGDEFQPEYEELVTSHGGPEALDSLEDLEGTDAVQSLLHEEVGSRERVASDSLDDLDISDYDEDDAEDGVDEEDGQDIGVEDGIGADWSSEEATASEEPQEAQPQAAVAEEAPAAPQKAAPASSAPDPSKWLYEEDLKYRAKLDQNPVYARLLPEVIDFWRDGDSWDTAISGSVHLDEHRHPEIAAVVHEVEAKMASPRWALYVCPERRMVCCITRGDPPTISLTTGIMNALNHDQQVFLVGRLTTMVMVGHLPYLQMAFLTLERSPRSITDVEIDMLELLKHHLGGWDAGVHREDRMKLGALCHAWQQRAELSADRGGLVCCGDLDVACDAIAKTVAPDSTAAQTASAAALLEKYKGQDMASLAAIAAKEDPIRHEGYGVYRIQMLKWWANTAAGKAAWQV
ncbi:MAG: tetratricopeptide repeat protein [Armatimonadota bacterium]